MSFSWEVFFENVVTSHYRLAICIVESYDDFELFTSYYYLRVRFS